MCECIGPPCTHSAVVGGLAGWLNGCVATLALSIFCIVFIMVNDDDDDDDGDNG